jgi:hypothetical protein
VLQLRVLDPNLPLMQTASSSASTLPSFGHSLLDLPTDVLRHLIIRASVLDPCSRAVCRFVCRRLRDLIPATSPDFCAEPSNSIALNFVQDGCSAAVPTSSSEASSLSGTSSAPPAWADPALICEAKPPRYTLVMLAARQGNLAVLQWYYEQNLLWTKIGCSAWNNPRQDDSSKADPLFDTSDTVLAMDVRTRVLRPALLHNAAECGHKHVLLWLTQEVGLRPVRYLVPRLPVVRTCSR